MAPDSVKGFTLLELITVLILISILALIAIVQWPGMSINLSAQADQLLADIRYTQSLAMTRNQRYRINFAADRYWITNLDATVTVPHPRNGAAVMMLNPGISLAATQPYLVFDRNARPYTNSVSPGSPLLTEAVITLTADSDTHTVRINPETGRTIKQ